MRKNNKVKDSGSDISFQSRLDRYWRKEGFSSRFLILRKPSLSPTSILKKQSDPYTRIIEGYKFSGLEFGNWVSNDARNSYLMGAVIALNDMQGILKFRNENLGFRKIGLAFGARGSGKASAHFEPGNWVINLTRYSRGDEFTGSGGLGALAHEYGHALDYYFGTYYTNNSPLRSLTRGRYAGIDFEGVTLNETSMAGLANKIVETAIWKTSDLHTPYYERLQQKLGGSDYWFRHNEIFARSFEQYISYKLEKRNIVNAYLTKQKYQNVAYPDQALKIKLASLFDKLIAKMRAVRVG